MAVPMDHNLHAYLGVKVKLETEAGCIRELHTFSTVEDFKTKVDLVRTEFACEECREHFQQLVQNHTFPLEHVTTVQEAKIWMWMAHNMVNMRIGKVWIPLTVLDQYEDYGCAATQSWQP